MHGVCGIVIMIEVEVMKMVMEVFDSGGWDDGGSDNSCSDYSSNMVTVMWWM